MDTAPQNFGSQDLAHARAALRSMAEQGLIEPSQLDDRLAALESGDQAMVALAGSAVLPAGYLPDDPLVLSAGMSNEERSGVWTIPPYLKIHAGTGNVRLNCLKATPAAPVIQVELSGGLGSVLLVLPDGWAVNVDRVDKGMGSLMLKVPNVPAEGCPLFVVRGSLAVGDFRARPASRWDLRRAAH
jgi:hypothetical protein